MNFLHISALAAVAAVLSLTSFGGLAYSRVVVNGTTFECQNRCVVSFSPTTGQAQVSDSNGGWVQIITSGNPINVLT
ncbi:MAG: hypothetical protein IT473_03220 [Lysobacter sp.]|nr:hypothetical protein [Lysobacter sp.]